MKTSTRNILLVAVLPFLTVLSLSIFAKPIEAKASTLVEDLNASHIMFPPVATRSMTDTVRDTFKSFYAYDGYKNHMYDITYKRIVFRKTYWSTGVRKIDDRTGWYKDHEGIVQTFQFMYEIH